MKSLLWLFIFLVSISFVIACTDGEIRDCGESLGVCRAGMQICENGAWSVCYGGSYSAAKFETCNGLDDDCDGTIDENCECSGGETQSCSSNVGVCVQGVQSCVNGSWGDCSGGIEPAVEVCGDLLDNDCDGMVDFEDDNCVSNKSVSNVIEENITREVVRDVECNVDLDCENGYECSRNVCLKKEEEKSEAGENETTSGDSDLPKEESNIIDYLIPIAIVVLVLLGVVLFYLQKNKKSAKTTNNRIETKATPYVLPTVISSNKIKSKVDKNIEESFKQSKDLFKK